MIISYFTADCATVGFNLITLFPIVALHVLWMELIVNVKVS